MQKFAGVRNLTAARDQAQIPILFDVGDLVFVCIASKVIRQSRFTRSTHLKMQARSTEIRVDQQDTPGFLPDERLRQIGGNKRLAFGWSAAGDKNSLQGLRRSDLVKPRTQGPEFLGANGIVGMRGINALVRIYLPLFVGAAFREFLKSENSGIQFLRRAGLRGHPSVYWLFYGYFFLGREIHQIGGHAISGLSAAFFRGFL
jgi:hypothetical protein